MTTEELVAEAIEYARTTTSGSVIPRHMRQIHSDRVGGTWVDRFSVALNDETRDVRYVERLSYFTAPTPSKPKGEHVVEVYEVVPRVKVNVEYERVW